MPTPGRRALSTALALAAVGLSACGSEDGTIPPQDAEALLAQLEEVEAAVEDGDCTSAQTDVSQLTAEVNALPEEVGVETKESLRRLSENLSELVPQQCEEETGATGETFEETTEPTTTTPTTEATTTTEEEAEEPPEQPDDEGTGVPPENGNGPPGQEGNPNDSGGVGEED